MSIIETDLRVFSGGRFWAYRKSLSTYRVAGIRSMRVLHSDGPSRNLEIRLSWILPGGPNWWQKEPVHILGNYSVLLGDIQGWMFEPGQSEFDYVRLTDPTSELSINFYRPPIFAP